MNLPIGITGTYRITWAAFCFFLREKWILITFNLSSAYPNYIDNRLDNCKPLLPMFFFSSFSYYLAVAGQKLYYGSHYPRLQSLKDQYDPMDTFNFPTAIEE